MKKNIGMNLCILTSNFPTIDRNANVFVEQLVIALSNQGHKITVISPESITKWLFRGGKLAPKHYWCETEEGATYEVIRPRYFSVGRNKFLGWINKATHKWALNRAFKKINIKECNALYGHFWSQACALSPFARKFNKPLFVACGEGDNALEEMVASFSIQEKKILKKTITGVVSVSSENKRKCIDFNLVNESDICVLPNGVNKKIFKPLDRSKYRQMFNIGHDDFVICFVGYFVHRKGSLRLSNAIKILNNEKIKVFFLGCPIGGDDATPDCNGIIYKGSVDHSKLPLFLSSSDVFVLPTLKEGCCNAIIEALSCGLPVISSKGSFNDDVLDETCSIRIDPLDENAIADAIKKIMNDKELQSQMREGAIKKCSDFSIEKRASKIVLFIEDKIKCKFQ